MKKFFALLAVAALAFAVGCGGETKKPVKIEKKDDGTTKIEAEVKPGEKADIKVDEKGTEATVKPEEPKEEPKADTPKADTPKEEPKEEPKADAPKEEPKADAPKEEPKAEDK